MIRSGMPDQGEDVSADWSAPLQDLYRIWRELDAIISRNNESDVVLVDDARLYGRRLSYPTLTEIKEKLLITFPHCSITLHNDIACFLLGRL